MENKQVLNYKIKLSHLLNGDFSSIGDLLKNLRSSIKKLGEASVDLDISPDVLMLLKYRIHLKNKSSFEKDEILRLNFSNEYFKGESLLIHGEKAFEENEKKLAFDSFSKAIKHFREAGDTSRVLYSQYMINICISSKWSARDFNLNMSSLEDQARKANENYLLGLIQKEKSLFYFKNSQYEIAIFEAEKALTTFSDLENLFEINHMKIHMADCYFHLNNFAASKQFLNNVEYPLAENLEFPFSYVHGKNQGFDLDLEAFSTIPLSWKERYNKYYQSIL